MAHINIEAVTVCVHYGDFLAAVAPLNAPLIDKWVIVTEPSDEETRMVCRMHGLQCLLTEDHYRNDADFGKGRAIERGLHHLSANSWRMHIDADIALPSHFHRFLDQAHLHESNIYGADRILVKSWEDWQKLLATGWLNGMTRRYPYCVDVPQGYEVGARWASHEAGYVPIGFLQMWHGSSDEWLGVRVKPYPQNHGTACRTDVQHALQWDRRNRILIPEIFVAHLESEKAARGANWKGRETKRFGPLPKYAARSNGPS